jgi:hypothetical protein
MTTHEAARPNGTAHDDVLTVCEIAVLAAMIASVLHEGIGHAAIALLTGTRSGVLTAVAWSSEYDSRLVAAGGTLVNLAAAIFFWIVLRRAKNAAVELRYFLVLSLAFNLFDGTGYFFFSGVTDFGDWATVIQPMHPHWAWRSALTVAGIASYFGAVVLVGKAYVQELGIPPDDATRLWQLSLLPYISAIAIVCLAGWFNPIGKQLIWQSALPATAGGHSGLLWFRYYIPKGTLPSAVAGNIQRTYRWIIVAAAASLIFVVVLGYGITLSR